MKNILLALSLLLPLGVMRSEPSAPDALLVVPVAAERRLSTCRWLCGRRTGLGPNRQGSCVWATMVSLLRWQGRYHTADLVHESCGDGAGPTKLEQKFNQFGIRFAWTLDGDVEFLEWAVRTRRGCGVATVMDGKVTSWRWWRSTTKRSAFWTIIRSESISGYPARFF